VNKVQGLGLYPVTIEKVLRHMKGGQLLLDSGTKTDPKLQVVQEAVRDLAGAVGRGVKEAFVGCLGQANAAGLLSNRDISEMTGATVRYIQKAKKLVKNGNLGMLGSMQRSCSRTTQLLCPSRADVAGVCMDGEACTLLHECQCCKKEVLKDGEVRNHAAKDCPHWDHAKAKRNNAHRVQTASTETHATVSCMESVATRGWFSAQNPARSGDQKEICWMVKGFTDFYHEEFRPVQAQKEIIRTALGVYGDNLRDQATSKAPKNTWLQNVATYLHAEAEGELHKLHVKDIRPNDIEDIAAALNDDDIPDVYGHKDPAQPDDGSAQRDSAQGEKDGDEGHPGWEDTVEEMIEDNDDDDYRLKPRTSRFFYKRLLAGMRLWKRPPHNSCDRCAQFFKSRDRALELRPALLSIPEDPEYNRHQELVERAGGQDAANEELRKIDWAMHDLKKHMSWQSDQRPYNIWRDSNLEAWQVMLYLDYGGFTDSSNKKVSVWSATLLAMERAQEHVDFFFDQDRKDKHIPGAAKKNAMTGIAFLTELFDPALGPNKDGISLFHHLFPDQWALLLSGDTGNGYRSYAMLEHLSKFHFLYGLTVELMPLPPGHAHNRTDARIAHQNTFSGAVKRKSKVEGAKGFARIFHKASDPKYEGTRTYMHRSHCFYREVEHKPEEYAELQNRSARPWFPRMSTMATSGCAVCCTLTSPSSDPRGRSSTRRAMPACASTRTRYAPTIPPGSTPGAKTLQRRCANHAATPMVVQCR
jgi:phage pi2 protein 07